MPTIYVFSRNKKNNAYSSKPQFYYIKVRVKGVSNIWACFRDEHKLRDESTNETSHFAIIY